MGVLDGVHVPQGEGWFGGFVVPIGLNGICYRMFKTDVYLTYALKVDSISVRTMYHWNRYFIGFLKIQSSSRSMVVFTRNLQKCNNHFALISVLTYTSSRNCSNYF